MIESISLNGVNAKQQYKYERRSRTKTGTSLSFSMQMPTILCILRVVLCVLWINEINYNSNFNNYIDNSNDSFGVYGFVIRNSNIHSNKNVNINSDFFSQFRNAPTQRTSTRTPTADKKASPKPSRTKLLMGQKGGSKGDSMTCLGSRTCCTLGKVGTEQHKAIKMLFIKRHPSLGFRRGSVRRCRR